MKKGLIMISMLALLACGQAKNNETAKPADQATTTATATDTATPTNNEGATAEEAKAGATAGCKGYQAELDELKSIGTDLAKKYAMAAVMKDEAKKSAIVEEAKAHNDKIMHILTEHKAEVTATAKSFLETSKKANDAFIQKNQPAAK